MQDIIVYSSKVCPNCNALKQYLDKIDVKYIIVDMGTPEALTDLRMNGVYTMSAPVLKVGNKYYTSLVLFPENKFNADKAKLAVQGDSNE